MITNVLNWILGHKIASLLIAVIAVAVGRPFVARFLTWVSAHGWQFLLIGSIVAGAVIGYTVMMRTNRAASFLSKLFFTILWVTVVDIAISFWRLVNRGVPIGESLLDPAQMCVALLFGIFITLLFPTSAGGWGKIVDALRTTIIWILSIQLGVILFGVVTDHFVSKVVANNHLVLIGNFLSPRNVYNTIAFLALGVILFSLWKHVWKGFKPMQLGFIGAFVWAGVNVVWAFSPGAHANAVKKGEAAIYAPPAGKVGEYRTIGLRRLVEFCAKPKVDGTGIPITIIKGDDIIEQVSRQPRWLKEYLPDLQYLSRHDDYILRCAKDGKFDTVKRIVPDPNKKGGMIEVEYVAQQSLEWVINPLKAPMRDYNWAVEFVHSYDIADKTLSVEKKLARGKATEAWDVTHCLLHGATSKAPKSPWSDGESGCQKTPLTPEILKFLEEHSAKSPIGKLGSRISQEVKSDDALPPINTFERYDSYMNYIEIEVPWVWSAALAAPPDQFSTDTIFELRLEEMAKIKTTGPDLQLTFDGFKFNKEIWTVSNFIGRQSTMLLFDEKGHEVEKVPSFEDFPVHGQDAIPFEILACYEGPGATEKIVRVNLFKEKYDEEISVVQSIKNKISELYSSLKPGQKKGKFPEDRIRYIPLRNAQSVKFMINTPPTPDVYGVVKISFREVFRVSKPDPDTDIAVK